MAEIVDFVARREAKLGYWRCQCGCMTYYLRSDGCVECAQCRGIDSESGYWRVPPDDTDEPRAEMDDADPAVKIVDLGAELSLARVLNRADPGVTFTAIILQHDGSMHLWSVDIDTRARRGWLRRHLEAARKRLVETDGPRD